MRRLALPFLFLLSTLSPAPLVSERAVHAPVLLAAEGPPSGAQAIAPRIDTDQLIADVRALAAPEMEGRRTGTPGSRLAQAFILERFRHLGLKSIGGTHQQKFAQDREGSHPEGQPPAVNLFGLSAGRAASQQYVLVGAHYDHLGVRGGQLYPGADDNASGVAAMLAIAAEFTREPAQHAVMFIAFDAEEQGLQGARHFVANPPVPLDRVLAFVNLDMVGRGDGGRLVVAGTHHYPALRPIVEAAAAGHRLPILFGYDQPAPLGRRRDDWTTLSDHGAFHAAGIPFLYFGVEDHPDYHETTDTADRISPGFLAEATALVRDTVRRLAGPVNGGL